MIKLLIITLLTLTLHAAEEDLPDTPPLLKEIFSGTFENGHNNLIPSWDEYYFPHELLSYGKKYNDTYFVYIPENPLKKTLLVKNVLIENSETLEEVLTETKRPVTDSYFQPNKWKLPREEYWFHGKYVTTNPLSWLDTCVCFHTIKISPVTENLAVDELYSKFEKIGLENTLHRYLTIRDKSSYTVYFAYNDIKELNEIEEFEYSFF